MEITHKVRLNNEDILEAITVFLAEKGVSTEGQKLTIELTAGRKNRGHYAHITLEPQSDAPDVVDEPVEEDVEEPAVAPGNEALPETTDEDSDNESLFN